MVVHLDDDEKGILKYLGRADDVHLTLNDISKYLIKDGYKADYTNRNIDEMMDHLIDAGYARSKTITEKGERKRIFYLSRVPLIGGKAKQKRLQGRGIVNDLSTIIRKLTGVVFLLAGMGLAIYEGTNFTGAAIGTNVSGFLVGVLFIFIAFTLLVFNPKKK